MRTARLRLQRHTAGNAVISFWRSDRLKGVFVDDRMPILKPDEQSSWRERSDEVRWKVLEATDLGKTLKSQ